MRYSKSMIEAVQQVGLYEMLDYAIIDGDNKIIGLYKGNMAKKQAQMNMKGAERQVGIKKPLKIMPVSNKKKGDTVIGIGELTDKQRGEIEEGKIEFKQDSKDVISIMKKGKLQGKMKKTPKGWAVVRGGRDFPITGGKNLDVAKAAVRDLFGEDFELDEVRISDYVVDTLRNIKRSKSSRNLKLKGGDIKIDTDTANKMLDFLDNMTSPMGKRKIVDILDRGTKKDFMKVNQAVMKAVR